MNYQFSTLLNQYLQSKRPFLFLSDFEQTKFEVLTFEAAAKKKIYFNIKGVSNFDASRKGRVIQEQELQVQPVSKTTYIKGFNKVMQNILHGNTFLLNLTFPSEVNSKNSLFEIFYNANAPYKLFYKDAFIVFSPECFVQIKGDHIYSYPMKGTIDAKIPDAKNLLLKDQKELYEHNTIVDLIRNDLSIIASEVTVTKFRYLDKIKSNKGDLYQTSSEIRGKLPENWKDNFETMLFQLLPAGSISGAPKQKTLEIIKNAEQDKRGFYTGIFGIFDGKNIDSAVSIRYIEKKEGKLWYRSGGGITHLSKAEEEYNELIKKIYVPTF